MAGLVKASPTPVFPGAPGGSRAFDQRPRAQLFLLFLGAFGAAALSGAAGFGGALLLLPLLAHSVVTWRCPCLPWPRWSGMWPRVALGFSQIRWWPVTLFLATGLPGCILGALSFVSIDKTILVRLTGAAILAFVFIRLRGS